MIILENALDSGYSLVGWVAVLFGGLAIGAITIFMLILGAGLAPRSSLPNIQDDAIHWRRTPSSPLSVVNSRPVTRIGLQRPRRDHFDASHDRYGFCFR